MDLNQFFDEEVPELLFRDFRNHRHAWITHNPKIHEAGHSVIAEVIYGEVLIPRVFSDDDKDDKGQFGVTVYQDQAQKPLTHAPMQTHENRFPLNSVTVKQVIEKIAVIMAGYSAEIIADGEDHVYGLRDDHEPWYRIRIVGGDEMRAIIVASMVQGITFPDIAVAAWVLSMRLLKENWQRVLEVADSIVIEKPTDEINQFFDGLDKEIDTRSLVA